MRLWIGRVVASGGCETGKVGEMMGLAVFLEVKGGEWFLLYNLSLYSFFHL